MGGFPNCCEIRTEVGRQVTVHDFASATGVSQAPHLVTRGSLDFFLQRQSFEKIAEKGSPVRIDSSDLEGYSVG
jgi:hypothetical protein